MPPGRPGPAAAAIVPRCGLSELSRVMARPPEGRSPAPGRKVSDPVGVSTCGAARRSACVACACVQRQSA
jgi:hypothetical protein